MFKDVAYRLNYYFYRVKFRHNIEFVVKDKKIPLTIKINADKDSRVNITSFCYECEKTTINIRKNASLTIGENFCTREGVIITVRGNVEIKDNVIFMYRVSLFDHDHDYKTSEWKNNYIVGQIKIDSNTMIGSKTIILKNTYVQNNKYIYPCSILKGLNGIYENR